jgi:hypothetical protein
MAPQNWHEGQKAVWLDRPVWDRVRMRAVKSGRTIREQVNILIALGLVAKEGDDDAKGKRKSGR